MTKTKKNFLIFLILALFLGVIIWRLFFSGSVHQHKSDPLAVTIAAAEIKAVPLELQLPGSIEPVESVSVRAQITGILQKINFNPGDEIKTGDLLFEINADTFLSTLAQAKANLARDTAQY